MTLPKKAFWYSTYQPDAAHTDRVRDGRAFCARAVRGYQNGKCVYTGQASFQLSDFGIITVMPRVDPPDSDSDRPWTWNGVSMDPLVTCASVTRQDRSRRGRRGGSSAMARCCTGCDSKQQAYWVRSAEPVQDSLRVQQCVLAYVSDWRTRAHHSRDTVRSQT